MERKTWLCLDCRIMMQPDYVYNKFNCPSCGAEVWFPDDDTLIRAPQEANTNIVPLSYIPGTCEGKNVDKTGKSKKEKMKKPIRTFIPYET